MSEETSFSGKNLRDMPMFLEVQSYQVAEWVPGDNGQGKPEAVFLSFNLSGQLDGVTLGVRLKSKAGVNRLVRLLEEYRDRVWP